MLGSNKDSETPPATHGTFSFGVVYANDSANAEIEKENPQFPVGSIIVREKNREANSILPETVIAMVKRENGFSKKTGDWEFFTFSGADVKMQKRETKGDCAKCHAQAEKSDWVFRDYLKK
ncbi:MAG: cytochrome P460 family protein [Pyrinomonadaceae bacterium]